MRHDGRGDDRRVVLSAETREFLEDADHMRRFAEFRWRARSAVRAARREFGNRRRRIAFDGGLEIGGRDVRDADGRQLLPL